MSNLRIYRKIEPGEFILAFADTSAGMGDYSACQFLSKTKVDVPMVYHSKSIATDMTNVVFPALEQIYDITRVRPVVAYERNNGGVFEMERLGTLNRLNKYELFVMPTFGKMDNPLPVKYGWETTTATRPRMLSDLKDAVDHKTLAIYDKPTVEEMYSFILVQTTSLWKAQAEVGAHDDLVMSLAGAWQLFQHCKPPVSPEHVMMDIPDESDINEGWY